uniref:Uncharacterized protein n=1 Tax=uncultured myxobacterium HF0200_08J13 TaxID=723558 RepID=E7C3N1_9BACT|nr:hypothetical protein [uncultured myxobacterium HF0200_08J13]
MNALASEETVIGNFSAGQQIRYQDTLAHFVREDGHFRMKIERHGKRHTYEVAETIGSRFFQYYVGHGIDGSPPDEHDIEYYTSNHVLPFGYWIDRQIWVPIVHISGEEPDEFGRFNPLDKPAGTGNARQDLVYSKGCNLCHTTFPLADMMIRDTNLVGRFAPARLHFSMSEYLSESHPTLWDNSVSPLAASLQDVNTIMYEMLSYDASEKAVTLGISCEACHLGCRAHAEKQQKKPSFFPHDRHLYVSEDSGSTDTGRTHSNLNWVCSRCHHGERPRFANGISTWNSTEFVDASRGSCYSEMTCIQCHDPHTTIGKKWSRSPDQDDGVCLKCHQQFENSDTRIRHTHHPAGTEGDRCMNCHMPRINEGMQDVVRTHTIFSPTDPTMILSGSPNACGLCHLEEPIDWTLSHMQNWYGVSFDEGQIAQAYPQREEPIAYVWLNHPHESVRLVTSDTIGQRNARWALPELVNQLDDPYLLNRQFAMIAVEELLDRPLLDFGYRFYMAKAERSQPLQLIRESVLRSSDRSRAPE